MFEQNSEDSFAHCERRRIMAYLANLKTSTPPFVLPHHLQNQILIQMLFLNPLTDFWKRIYHPIEIATKSLSEERWEICEFVFLITHQGPDPEKSHESSF